MLREKCRLDTPATATLFPPLFLYTDRLNAGKRDRQRCTRILTPTLRLLPPVTLQIAACGQPRLFLVRVVATGVLCAVFISRRQLQLLRGTVRTRGEQNDSVLSTIHARCSRDTWT